MEIEIKISGMSCGHCVAAVKKALESITGTVVSEVTPGNARMKVPEESAITAIRDAVSRAGYRVESVTKDAR